ncbi:hypothetical protein [Fodinicola acaciae]|uniref:hypothetical protein n=1 Tax=Fodinicola acaciae TaxID=2681555 RepID=UPI0013D1B883|nr:hypothetical protein [Fodinicola acaciae]
MLDLRGATRCGVGTAVCRVRASRALRVMLTVAAVAVGFWLAATVWQQSAYADTVPADPNQSVVGSVVGGVTDLTGAANTEGKADGATDQPVSAPVRSGHDNDRDGRSSGGLLTHTVGSLLKTTDDTVGSVAGVVHDLPVVGGKPDKPEPILDDFPGRLPCCLDLPLPLPLPQLPAPPSARPVPAPVPASGSTGSALPDLLPSVPAAKPAPVRLHATAPLAGAAQLISASGSPAAPGSFPAQPLFSVASGSGHTGTDASAWLYSLGSSGLGSTMSGPVGTDDLFILHTTAKPAVSPD